MGDHLGREGVPVKGIRETREGYKRGVIMIKVHCENVIETHHFVQLIFTTKNLQK
jgi:hypothetical protein